MHQDNISTFGKYFYHQLIKTLEFNSSIVWRAEARGYSNGHYLMDTNLNIMRMDVLLPETISTIIHHLLQYYSCSNVGNFLMNV